MHRTTDRFWKCFENLPDPIQKLSKKNFALLKANPLHPSLHFKKVGKFWSIRIGIAHRALAIEVDKDFIWIWIGTHSEYELMIKERS